MRRLFPSIIALLMVAGTLPAQTTDSPSTTKKDREPVGINLSLWKNMSTQQTDTVGSTRLHLGFFSLHEPPERRGYQSTGWSGVA